MYEAFFQLSRRPFLAAPSAATYFASAAHERSRQALARAIDRAEGPGLLIGPAGTGKTLLLQVLAEQSRADFKVALLAGTRLTTRRALLQNILFELGLPYRDREEGELRLSLIDHLAPSPNCPRGMLLLVDEAHTLPVRLLEEIRMITNLMRDGQPRVRLVLAGGSSLEERFASPRLESLNQRVATRCYLEHLTRDETGAYVRHQISLAGGNGQIMSDDALRSIHVATDGIPRLINQLCDHALLMAAVGRAPRLEPMHIEEAWADLQQLPTPFTETKSHAPVASSIEFGQLPDEPMASTAAAALNVVEQLHSIEQQVAVANYDWPVEEHLAVSSSEDADQFVAPLSGGTEVELHFHGPHNPFAERFQEEEVVLDPYAMLDTMGPRPRVSSAEGRELAHLMQPAAPASPPRPNLTIARESMEQELHAMESAAANDYEFIDVVEPPLDGLLGDPPPDDRDILVIEEESLQATANSGRARRQEYRNLFAKLRKG